MIEVLILVLVFFVLLGIGVLPKKDQYKEMLKEDKVVQSLSDCIHFME